MPLCSRVSRDQVGDLADGSADEFNRKACMNYLRGYGRPGTLRNGMREAVAVTWGSKPGRQRCRSLDTRDNHPASRLVAMDQRHVSLKKLQRIRTVFLHVDDHERSRVGCEGSVMRPVVWNSRQLALPDFVMGHLAGFLNDRAVIVSGIHHSQCPYSRRARRDQHEGTVHQPRGSSPLACLLGQPISRPIVSAAITAQPHLGRPAGLLLRWCTRRLDDHIVAMCFAVRLDGGEERRPRRKTDFVSMR